MPNLSRYVNAQQFLDDAESGPFKVLDAISTAWNAGYDNAVEHGLDRCSIDQLIKALYKKAIT